jgi:hypothetical protein
MTDEELSADAGSEDQEAEVPAAAEEQPEPGAPAESVPEGEPQARKPVPWGFLTAVGVAVIALAAIPIVAFGRGEGWGSNAMIATYVLVGLVIAGEIVLIITLKTARTRYSVEKMILNHGDVHEYAILWDRPRWVLFTPVMGVSILFGICMLLSDAGWFPQAITPRMLGGIWVVLCVLNVLVEQFHMSIKVVFIVVPTLGALLLLLHLINYADDVIHLVRYAAVAVPAKLYFMTAFVVALVMLIGWIQGLFYYMAITPNVADLQRGLTETGRQIKNADYDVDFDATDVVERWLFGFGRIIISFRDPSRPPMVFFVPHASKTDDRIRRVRSVTAIDRTPADQ